MSRDHQFFVCRHHIECDPAILLRYERRAGRVCCLIDGDSEPGQFVGDACAHAHRVLADPGREHEGVEAAEGGCQHAGIEADAVGEVLERKFSYRIRACFETPFRTVIMNQEALSAGRFADNM
jgi:hypothetical protein